MTYQQYIAAWQEYRRDFPTQRKGQAAFNLLYRIRPDLAEDVRSTQLDPFHRDDNLRDFLRFVEENW